MLRGLVRMAKIDPEVAESVAALPWVGDGVTENERVVMNALAGIVAGDTGLAGRVASLVWIVDSVTEAESATLDKLSDIASEDVEFAMELVSLPWFMERVSRTTDQVLQSLYDVAKKDRELGKEVIALPWVTAYATDVRITTLYRLSNIASKDVEFAREIVSLPWFIESVTRSTERVLTILYNISLKDSALGKQAMSLSWLAGGVTWTDIDILNELEDIASEDLEFAKEVAALAWLTDDDFTDSESHALRELGEMATEHLDFAKEVVVLDWLTDDDLTEDEARALRELGAIATEDLEFAKEVVVLAWLTDDELTEDEATALRALGVFFFEDEELAKRVASVPWFIDDLTEIEKGTLQELTLVASYDLGLAKDLSTFSWFVDGVTATESETIERLARIASRSVELAKQVAALPWLVDDLTEEEGVILTAIFWIARKDVELTRKAVALPWLADEVTEAESRAFDGFRFIARIDPILANDITAYPWFSGEISQEHADALYGLAILAYKDLPLTRALSMLPWLVDGVTENERNALDRLNDIASENVELAKELAVKPWFTDGVSEDEGAVRSALVEVASRDAEFANEMAVLPWLTNGATMLEISAIYSLSDIATTDEEFVRKVIGWPRFGGRALRDLDFFLLYAFSKMDSEPLDELTAQPWFSDGLDDEEVALVVTLPYQDPELQKALMNDGIVRREEVSLPLAGEVTLWVVQDGGFELKDNVLSQMDEALRITEDFMGTPFPTTDVILLVASEEGTGYRVRQGYFGFHMAFESWEGDVYYGYQDTARYYLSHNFRNHRWLEEGGVKFVEAEFSHEIRLQDLSERKEELLWSLQSDCIDHGVENIRHDAYVMESEQVAGYYCTHILGEYLLRELKDVLGKNAMSSAMNEIYVVSGGHVPALRFSTPPSEEEIFEAFMKHAPAQRRGEVRELFQTLHGGDFAFPEIHKDDAEADAPPDAMLIEVGETVEGSLDYIFDFDYFGFQAVEGQRYRISVEHKDLGHTSITLYGPNGLNEEHERWKGRGQGQDGPLILWQASSSNVNYFAVQNFGGKTGDYAFTITPVAPAGPDDHGDEPESATEIGLGRLVSGNIDHDFDYDYFSFDAREGEEYTFNYYGGSFNILCADLIHRDGSRDSDWNNDCDIIGRWNYSETFGQSWIAQETGTYYLVLYGYAVRVGRYEFEVTR